MKRFVKGDNNVYAPFFPIWFLKREREILERLRRFDKGDNSDYAPLSPILL